MPVDSELSGNTQRAGGPAQLRSTSRAEASPALIEISATAPLNVSYGHVTEWPLSTRIGLRLPTVK
jgi:hypothetical protein